MGCSFSDPAARAARTMRCWSPGLAATTAPGMSNQLRRGRGHDSRDNGAEEHCVPAALRDQRDERVPGSAELKCKVLAQRQRLYQVGSDGPSVAAADGADEWRLAKGSKPSVYLRVFLGR